MTEVRDQQNCDAGFAFSFVAAQEAMHAIQSDYDEPIPLSVQELIDCAPEADSPNYYKACKRHWYVTGAWYWARDNGHQKETDYPFENRQNHDECKN